MMIFVGFPTLNQRLSCDNLVERLKITKSLKESYLRVYCVIQQVAVMYSFWEFSVTTRLSLGVSYTTECV